jgi:hypothetical protein
MKATGVAATCFIPQSWHDLQPYWQQKCSVAP